MKVEWQACEENEVSEHTVMSPGKTCVVREDFAVFGSNGLLILLCMVIWPQRDLRTRLRRAERLLFIIYLAADDMFVWSSIHWPVDGRGWTAT